jgi:hypothetical protein
MLENILQKKLWYFFTIKYISFALGWVGCGQVVLKVLASSLSCLALTLTEYCENCERFSHL